MRKPSPREAKCVILQVRVDIQTKARLGTMARQRDCSVSQLLRDGIRRVLASAPLPEGARTDTACASQVPSAEVRRDDDATPLPIVLF